MKLYKSFCVVLLTSAVCGQTAEASKPIQLSYETLGPVFAKVICAPSKERLETQEVYNPGDMVRVVHGPKIGFKGKVIGSFAQITGKNTTQDVLEELKKDDDNLGIFVMSLVPHKARKFMKNKPMQEANAKQSIVQELAKQSILLDATRLYKIEFKQRGNEKIVASFEYEHVACLKRIAQQEYEDPYNSDSDDKLFNGQDIDRDDLEDEA